MALSDERIWDSDAIMSANAEAGLPMPILGMLCRTVEAEVRKQDEALIRQMLDALEWQERPLCMCWAGCDDCNPENAPNAVAAIAAALKRLEGKP